VKSKKEKEYVNKPNRKRRARDWKLIMIVAIFIIYMGVTFINNFKNSEVISGDITYDELMENIESGRVQSIKVTKSKSYITVEMKDGTTLSMVNPQSDTFIEDLLKAGANINYQKESYMDSFAQVFLMVPTAALLAMLTVYIARTTAGASTKSIKVIKSKDNHITFEHIKGMSETKEEVRFLVNSISNWKHLEDLGARPIKGILLYGPPGTGKTMLAKAIAKEANVPFISASGSDFIEMFVGTGARRIRDLWDMALSNTPCIVFIDEIDCLGKRMYGASDSSENNRTINALLQKMDGLDNNNGVMVIAATNNRESLDKALLRSGRFDRELYVGPPNNSEDRNDVVSLYLSNKKVDKSITVDLASKLLIGMTPADIDETLNEAVYISLSRGRNGVISIEDIDYAMMKIRTHGVKKEFMSRHDYNIAVVHESGHAVAAALLGKKVIKVSVMPYSSGVGGITLIDKQDDEENSLKTKKEMMDEIFILLAGRCAEEIILGDFSSGCSDDLRKATKLAVRMVNDFGVCYEPWISSNYANRVAISEEVGAILNVSDIQKQCENLIYNSYKEVKTKLSRLKGTIKKLAEELNDKGTIINPSIEIDFESDMQARE